MRRQTPIVGGIVKDGVYQKDRESQIDKACEDYFRAQGMPEDEITERINEIHRLRDLLPQAKS